MLLGLIYLAIVVLMIASQWKVFTKAGQPGWASIVPFYNIYVLLQVGGKPGWWLVLFLVPVVNLVVGILTLLAVAKTFGKGGGFVVGLILLPIVFWPILAFDGSTYTRPAPAA
jgi:hypothetical protein